MLLFSLFLPIFNQEVIQAEQEVKKHPMASIMGVDWGINAQKFIIHFKYRKQIHTYKAFYLTNFRLGDLVIEEIDFNFTSGEDQIKFKSKNYTKLFLEKVIFHISPNQFEDLLKIFKIKYGEPLKFREFEIQNRMGAKFLQKIALWANSEIQRMINMTKYSTKLDQGKILFIPYDPNFAKERKEKLIEAADDL